MILNPSADNNSQSIIIGVQECKTLNNPLHYHLDYYELTYIEGGKGIIIIGDKIQEFSGNDLVLVPPRVPHTWISFKNRELTGAYRFRYITLQFTLEFFGEELLLRPEMSNIRRLLVAAERVVILKGINVNAIINELFNLKLESDFNTYIRILEIFNRLGMGVELSQLLESQYLYRGNRKDLAKFEKVFGYILGNYTQRIRVSEPARILGLNDTAFSHYFRKRTGKSFTDFINELRLLESDALVRNTHKKIARISSECGFNNLSNFNRLYKNSIGMTPVEKRKASHISN